MGIACGKIMNFERHCTFYSVSHLLVSGKILLLRRNYFCHLLIICGLTHLSSIANELVRASWSHLYSFCYCTFLIYLI